jgi:hypothetical protein
MVTGCAINAVSKFYGSLCSFCIVQGEYLIRISHVPAKKPVMLVVSEVS